MHHISFFSSSLCCCFLFLIIPHENFSKITAISVDIINQTCKKCADESHVFSYNLCTTSLQAVPVSHVANLQGLALIAMELALNNATKTVLIIENLLTSNESVDPFAVVCLKDCLQLYSDGIATLVDAVEAFLGEHYDTANIWLRFYILDELTEQNDSISLRLLLYATNSNNYPSRMQQASKMMIQIVD